MILFFILFHVILFNDPLKKHCRWLCRLQIYGNVEKLVVSVIKICLTQMPYTIELWWTLPFNSWWMIIVTIQSTLDMIKNKRNWTATHLTSVTLASNNAGATITLPSPVVTQVGSARARSVTLTLWNSPQFVVIPGRDI